MEVIELLDPGIGFTNRVLKCQPDASGGGRPVVVVFPMTVCDEGWRPVPCQSPELGGLGCPGVEHGDSCLSHLCQRRHAGRGDEVTEQE